VYFSVIMLSVVGGVIFPLYIREITPYTTPLLLHYTKKVNYFAHFHNYLQYNNNQFHFLQ